MTDNLERTKKALDMLMDSMMELSELWKEDAQVCDVLSRPGDLYPFEKSFDKITDDVRDWAAIAWNEAETENVICKMQDLLMCSDIPEHWIIPAIKTLLERETERLGYKED